jgi:uncharacterized protein (TIRG00374 family)
VVTQMEKATTGNGISAQRRHLRLYVIIAIGVSVAAIVLLSFLTMDRNTLKAISRIDIYSFVVVVVLVVGKWVSECVRFNLIIRGIGRRIPLWSTAKAVLGSAFTGSVTPYRSATVPVQIFFFTRYGLTGGEATAVASVGAALSVLLLTIAMPVVLLLSAAKIHVSFGIRALLVMGASIGFLVFVVAVFSMRDPHRVTRLMDFFTPSRYHERPKYRRAVERLTDIMEDFSESLRRLLKGSKARLAAIAGLTVFFWLSEMFVASWLLRGLGYPQFFWKALLAQVIVSSILPFTPVPGESGVAEGTFAAVFSVFVARNLVGVVTLAWRFFMFYLPLIFLSIMFVLASNDASRLRQWEEIDAGATAPAQAVEES